MRNIFGFNRSVDQQKQSFGALIAALFVLFVSGSVMGQTQWPDMIPGNIAQFKPTKQSSIFEAGHSNRAVDGNTDGNWWSRSVSHTNETPNPWWEVNLLEVYDISSITIYNRTDCCTERLTNFSIRVASAPFTSNTNGEVFTDRQSTFTGQKTFNGNKRGQYIRIYLNQPGIMSLSEVVVNGKVVNPTLADSDDNIALGKPARQSSNWDFGAANRANDGDINGRLDAGSISHTNGDNQAFWEVDLGKKYLIETIKVYNRTDGYQERLNNFNILVTEEIIEDMTNNYQPFAEKEKKFDGPSKTFSNKKSGRFVRVELNDQNYLHMAELQVFGREAGDITIGPSSSNVLYKVSIFRNLSDTENTIQSKVATSIEEGMDFSRTASTTHKDYWSLSATAKVSAKYGVVDFEASVTADGGQENTSSSSSTNSNNLKESNVEEVTTGQKVAGKSVRYEFHKFAINQSPVTYRFNDVDYSWYRIDKGAASAREVTVLEIPAELEEQFLMTNDNWMGDDEYKKVISKWGRYKKPN